MQATRKYVDILTVALFVIAGWVVNIVMSALFLLIPQGENRVYLIESYKGIVPGLGYTIMAIGLVIVAIKYFRAVGGITQVKTHGLELELSEVIKRAQEEPDKVKPAWDLARVRLELYFDRNLSQINYIFWLSVGVMGVGFLFILFGITNYTASAKTGDVNPATSATAVAGVAGVITEFIGATFLFIYRSTIEQAANYTKTLERINSVGMAMQILDSISAEASGLRDQTKADIVKLLLSQSEASAKATSKQGGGKGKGKKESPPREGTEQEKKEVF